MDLDGQKKKKKTIIRSHHNNSRRVVESKVTLTLSQLVEEVDLEFRPDCIPLETKWHVNTQTMFPNFRKSSRSWRRTHITQCATGPQTFPSSSFKLYVFLSHYTIGVVILAPILSDWRDSSTEKPPNTFAINLLCMLELYSIQLLLVVEGLELVIAGGIFRRVARSTFQSFFGRGIELLMWAAWETSNPCSIVTYVRSLPP